MKSAQLDRHANSTRTTASTAGRRASTAAPATEPPFALIGQCAGWFQVRREGEAIVLEPRHQPGDRPLVAGARGVDQLVERHASITSIIRSITSPSS